MKKIALLIVMYFLFIGAILAQNISGSVTNENGEPLPGATVKLEKTFYAATTNASGEFFFNKIKPGTYQLSTSFLGYETKYTEIEINQETQTIKIQLIVSENLTDEVVVNALRAGKKTPVATTEIDKSDLQKNNAGQDVPYLLNLCPSITTSSDAGAGIGYSKLSIRGTDLTRINVTVNGIPLNDAESHGVWWVDLPDLASSVENIQIQRGVGSSTNGAAAFGANMNFSTNQLQKEAYSQINASYGSFNSQKYTLKAGTGLINKHFAFDLRLSKIHSDGFIDRATTDMESLFMSGSYSDAKTLVKINIISGQEETFQSWWGVPKARLDNDMDEMQRYEDHGLYTLEETEHLKNSDSRTYNYYTYDNSVDNYKQSHYQTFVSREINKNLILNAAFNYTKGKGYYENYNDGKNLVYYGIDTTDMGNNATTDLIARKWLDNDLYVVNFSMDYKKDALKFIIGGSWQDYFGKHFGNIIWAQKADSIKPNYQWYYNTGDKREYNIYTKFEYLVANKLNLYVDLQYRSINYIIEGVDDNLKDISQEHNFNFFNPKFGINYNISEVHRIYSTFGIANREPSRTDFKDAINGKTPDFETLNDFEFGYSFSTQKAMVNLNFYYMDYNNQLIKTGKINDVGGAIMTNIPNSYRSGIEISSSIKILDIIKWNFNTTISRNRVKSNTEYVDNWDEGGQREITIGESNISFSPELIVGSDIEIKAFKGFSVSFQSKYVDKQYIDNSSASDRMLDAYFVNNILFNYHFETKFIKSIDLQFNINNVFNEEYETDGWVYRYYLGNEYYNMDGYFPQAGTNVMAGIVLNF